LPGWFAYLPLPSRSISTAIWVSAVFRVIVALRIAPPLRFGRVIGGGPVQFQRGAAKIGRCHIAAARCERATRRWPRPIADGEILERAMRFELTTLTLARLCSTPELRPHPWVGGIYKVSGTAARGKSGQPAESWRCAHAGPGRRGGARGAGAAGSGRQRLVRSEVERAIRAAVEKSSATI